MGDETITVTGEAESHAPPDVAAWNVTVQATDPDARAAYDRCAQQSAALVERLKAIAEVETRTIAVHRTWEDEGFEHEAEMAVVVRAPVAHAAELAQAAMAAGAPALRGPELSITDRGALELEVLEEAVADARRQAERLAAAAGRPLGRIVSIDAKRDRMWMELMSIRGERVPVEPGDLAIRAGVTVVFAFGD